MVSDKKRRLRSLLVKPAPVKSLICNSFKTFTERTNSYIDVKRTVWSVCTLFAFRILLSVCSLYLFIEREFFFLMTQFTRNDATVGTPNREIVGDIFWASDFSFKFLYPNSCFNFNSLSSFLKRPNKRLTFLLFYTAKAKCSDTLGTLHHFKKKHFGIFKLNL